MPTDRTAHRILIDDLPPAGGPGVDIIVDGDEARHALRVKRLNEGERVELFDGRGRVARGVVARRDRHALTVELLGAVDEVSEVSPRVEVWCPMPGVDRAGAMVEQLSQCGAAAWVPMRTGRAQRDPSASQLEKFRRVARESAKQCGRAWVMDVELPRSLDEALEVGGDIRLVAMDATGSAPVGMEWGPTVRVLVGPEGGWTDAERAGLAGATMLRAGPHVLRLETAAVVGAAMVLAQEAR